MADEISLSTLNTKLEVLIERTGHIQTDLTDIKRDNKDRDSKIGCNEKHIKTLQSEMKDNTEEIDSLRKKADGWNTINSLGVAVAAIIAWFKGGE